MRKSTFILTLFIFMPLLGFANLENHFKKAYGKSDQNKMPNIDFIYVINLDERPEKWHATSEKLKQYNIFPYRFSAVNGWTLSLKAINELGVKFDHTMQGGFMGTYYSLSGDDTPKHEMIQNYGKNYFSHCLSRGAIGIVLSHLSVLQDALDSKYETIWVMEDDIDIISDPNILSYLVTKLDKVVGKKNWDILFTDKDTKNNRGEYVPCNGFAKRPNFTPKHPKKFRTKTKISAEFRKVGARFGAYSMIIRRSGIKKILNFIKKYKIFLPYDMDNYLAPDIKMYTVRKDVVSHMKNAASDNGGANYKKNQPGL